MAKRHVRLRIDIKLFTTKEVLRFAFHRINANDIDFMFAATFCLSCTNSRKIRAFRSSSRLVSF